jgi:hypothetical protein
VNPRHGWALINALARGDLQGFLDAIADLVIDVTAGSTHRRASRSTLKAKQVSEHYNFTAL